MSYHLTPYPQFSDEEIGDFLIRKVAKIKAIGWVCLVQKSKLPLCDFDVVLSDFPPSLAGKFEVIEADGLAQAKQVVGWGKFRFLHLRTDQDLSKFLWKKVEIFGEEIAIQNSIKPSSFFYRTHQMLDLLGVEKTHPLRHEVVNEGELMNIVDGSKANPCHFIEMQKIKKVWSIFFWQVGYK